MIWILGGLAVICITSLVLSCYCGSVGLEILAFMSGVILLAVLGTWGACYAESRGDYRYLEECLQYSDSGRAISNARFLELYTKYKGENRYWITRQFNARPSKALVELFGKDYSLQLVFD